MATRKGYDIEAVFRGIFKIDPSIDVVTLMEAAIQVVSSTRPREFSDRMERTLKSIDAIKRLKAEDDQKKNKKSPNESDHQLCETRPRLKLIIKQNRSDTNAFKIREDDQKSKHPNKSDDLCLAKGDGDEEKKLNLKFENSRRKFQQGIDEIRQKKRKIQVLDIKDLPRAPPVLRNKGRVRPVH